MPLFVDPDGYLFAVQTPGEGDGNSVVYRPDGSVAWSKFEDRPQTHPSPSPQPQLPTPSPPTAPTPFPSRGVTIMRVTDARDGNLAPRMYSYWSNAWVDGDSCWVFAGHEDETPRLFEVSLRSGLVNRVGWGFRYRGTTEGWYWNVAGWIMLIEGPRLRRVNPFTGADQIICDISGTHPGCDLWQAHSSDDGSTHSATVRQIQFNGPYTPIGTLVSQYGQQRLYAWDDWPIDESAVTTDGAYLIVKRTPDDDNRVVTLATGETRTLLKADGALGHSDCGASLMVGADRANGTCALIDLRHPLRAGRPLFHTWTMGHLALRGEVCLVTDATTISRVALDGSGVVPLAAHGMVGSDYDHQVMTNLDPTGRVGCFISNHGTDRYDVDLLVL